MSQYITKNKLSGVQMQQLIREKEKLISDLQLENTILRNVISHIPGNVFWLNETGVYLGVNNNVAHFFGFSSPNEMIGKRNMDFMNEVYATALDQTNQEVMSSGTEHYVEEKGYDSENRLATYLCKKTPLFDQQGKTIGMIGVGFDITDRKRMEHELKIAKEKAEASNHAKSQFLAVMSHELNTPLASIIGLIEFLKRDDIPANEALNIMETIENCTWHLLNLVNEVLDFSKIEKGKSSVHKTFIDLSSLLKEVYNLLHLAAEKKGLDLQIKFKNKVDKAILTDSRLLLQILINLVNNAIKFTETGQITMQVTVVNKTSRTITLEIAVIDTGYGIPADKLDLIFEPFQQLEDSYTRESSRQGTGLGLAIVNKLAEQLGIIINVFSTLGRGSLFSLVSEFKTEDLEVIVDTTPDPNIKKPLIKGLSPIKSRLAIAAKKPLVLLVEDDPIIQYIHKKMLEELKCQVDIVSHGRNALKMLNQHDIVFVDLSLPDISGFEVIRSMRKQHPGSKVPIVALTVHTGKKEKQDSLDAGANKFASKPISESQLRKILMRYVVENGEKATVV